MGSDLNWENLTTRPGVYKNHTKHGMPQHDAFNLLNQDLLLVHNYIIHRVVLLLYKNNLKNSLLYIFMSLLIYLLREYSSEENCLVEGTCMYICMCIYVHI